MTKKKAKRRVLTPEVLERARAELRGESMASDAVVESVNGATTETRARALRTANVTVAAPRRIASVAELAEEYRFIISDLRSLFVVALALLAVIVVVALVVPPIAG